MVERGKKKRSVACAFDWPGWDRSGKTEEDALEVLEAYRPRFAQVAERAGLGDAFANAGEFEVVERVAGIGMTDFYGLSGVPPTPEHDQMSDAECERKIALLRRRGRPSTRPGHACRPSCARAREAAAASATRSSATSSAGRSTTWRTRSASRSRSRRVRIPRPCARTAPRSSTGSATTTPAASRRGPGTVQFLIRRCAWHMLDHAWEMEDRDQTQR